MKRPRPSSSRTPPSELCRDRLGRRIGDHDATASSGEAEGGGTLGKPCLTRRFTADGHLFLLSAILLLGLGANAIGGWWSAEPMAGLFMVPIIGKEGIGRAAWRALHMPH